jgi:hypothetical protein
MGDLIAEGEKIKIDAAATYDPDAPRTAGPKQCQYCKAAGKCSTLAQYNLEQYSVHFDDIEDSIELGIDLPEPDFDNWTDERKAWVLLHKSTFERWFKKLHEEALLEASRGQPWPLLKIVAGNAGHRAWDGKEEIIVPLLERGIADNKRKKDKPKAVVSKVMTPAAAQTAVGKKYYDEHLKPYVRRPPGKPIIVPETDPRDAIPTLGQQFDDAMLLEDDDDNGDNE